MSIALSKRIKQDILSPSSPYSAQNSDADVWVDLSNDVCIACDELVASMYTPQEEEELHEAASAFHGVIESLRQSVEAVLLLDISSLEDSFQNLSVDADSNRDKISQWFTTCFTQIRNTVSQI